MQYQVVLATILGTLLFPFGLAFAVEPEVVRIRMLADEQGELAEVQLNGEAIGPSEDGKRTRLDVLTSRIRALVQDDKGRPRETEFEVELEYPPALKYQYVIDVIRSISGYRTKNGEVVILVKRIKFVPFKVK
jgi:hypothetical protein